MLLPAAGWTGFGAPVAGVVSNSGVAVGAGGGSLTPAWPVSGLSGRLGRDPSIAACDDLLRRMLRRSVPLVAGALMTYIGGALLFVAGLTFLLGAHDGAYLGGQTDFVKIAGAPIPIGVAPVAGAVFAVVGLALVALAVMAQRGRSAGQLGLTLIGVLAMAGLVYTFLFADDISPLPPAAWIVVALTLLWVGKARQSG